MDVLSELTDAFGRGDVEKARDLAAAVGPESHRELDGLIAKLQRRIKGARKAELEEIVARLIELVQIEQSLLQSLLLPRIRAEGKHYRKFRRVHARRAMPGVQVVTTTGDGPETQNLAKEGDWIVRNTTAAQEQYVVNDGKFKARYRYVEDLEDGWALYEPIGEVFGVEVDDSVLKLLGRSQTFYIEARWGEAQRVEKGDELVAPPAFDEVYRVANDEFQQTYEPAP